MSGSSGRFGGWAVSWGVITLAAALVATVVDAILLQLDRGYFSGGFLATDYVASPGQAAGFAVGSLSADLAVCGVVVAASLWLFSHLRIRRSLAFAGALTLALMPIAASDFLEYQLSTYLGDAFNLGLLFDLSGRSVGELLAVSSAQVGQIVGLTVGSVCVGAAALWLFVRYLPDGGQAVASPRSWTTLLWPVALLVIGAGVSTMLRASSDVFDNGLRRKPTGIALGTIVGRLSDVDRDGSGVLGRPVDPDLFDGRVRPYALDVPGNGVDEDGVGGDLPADPVTYSEPEVLPTPWQSTPDVVLIVLESFRADARGAHVDGKAVTPVLDALAARGVAPRMAYSHNGYTVQSRHHIFSGSTAGVREPGTLVDDFHRQGYKVGYVSGQDESFGGPAWGVGFDRADTAFDARSDRERRYSNFSTAGSLAVPFTVVEERVGEFVDKNAAGTAPLFLYVNFHDTHFPYRHRFVSDIVSAARVAQGDIGPATARELREMYLNTAANVDGAIGRVIERVRQARGREPGVIVLSDHGESLYDEGFLGHGYALNDAQTRVPFIVSGLPLTLQEPIGQVELRDSIAAALVHSDGTRTTPTLDLNTEKAVFQYLGQITRPAQIAFTRASGRLIYDFREQRVRAGDGPWQRPDTLMPRQHEEFLQLVRAWERMMLARNSSQATQGD